MFLVFWDGDDIIYGANNIIHLMSMIDNKVEMIV